MIQAKTNQLLLIFLLGNQKTLKGISTKGEISVPEGDKVNYTFSGLGHLIYRNQHFFRSFTRGLTFTMVYKCLEFKTKKCPVILKTRGKYLTSIIGQHNHN